MRDYGWQERSGSDNGHTPEHVRGYLHHEQITADEMLAANEVFKELDITALKGRGNVRITTFRNAPRYVDAIAVEVQGEEMRTLERYPYGECYEKAYFPYVDKRLHNLERDWKYLSRFAEELAEKHGITYSP